MLVGYARVSTDLQTTDGQIDALHAVGCERVFEESMSGCAGRPSARPIGAIHTQAFDHRHRSLIDLILAMGMGMVGVTPSDPVQKSPSLTVAESWLSTVVSSVMLTVSRTICFMNREPGMPPDEPLPDGTSAFTSSEMRATQRQAVSIASVANRGDTLASQSLCLSATAAGSQLRTKLCVPARACRY